MPTWALFFDDLSADATPNISPKDRLSGAGNNHDYGNRRRCKIFSESGCRARWRKHKGMREPFKK
jgi:hypothetical protein